MRREVVEAARRLAEKLSKSGVDVSSVLRESSVQLERGDACEILEKLKPLVERYAAIEEGSIQPSNAYLALRPVVEAMQRLCRGGSLDEELVALSLAIIGLLEAGRVSRAAALAALLESRLR